VLEEGRWAKLNRLIIIDDNNILRKGTKVFIKRLRRSVWCSVLVVDFVLNIKDIKEHRGYYPNCFEPLKELTPKGNKVI